MKTPAPDPRRTPPTETSLLADLAAAGLVLAPAQVPGVLETARYLHRACGLIETCLHTAPDEPR
ncbi:MAG: hypothetical protein KF887_06035 [Paracoccaceae bacterium]|nr:MAG: hypothetical protein KF887_06035 [Paracoccaceae bacterium]